MRLLTVYLIFTVLVSVSAIRIHQSQKIKYNEGKEGGKDGGEYEAYGAQKDDEDAEDEGNMCVVKYMYKPVCGTDGKTYKNIDELNCSNIARAKAGMKAILIKNEGACPFGFLTGLLDIFRPGH